MARFVPIEVALKGEKEVVAGAQRISHAFADVAREQARAFRESPQFSQAQNARLQAEQLRAAARVQQEEVRANGRLQVEQLRQNERAARESAKAMMDTAKAAGREQIATDRQVARERLAQTRAAEADIRRVERERLQIAQQNARAMENLARQEANTRVREGRRAARELERDLAAQARGARRSPAQTGSSGLASVGVGAGALALGATTAAVSGLALLSREALTTAASLDTLIRYTSTLDKTFQSASGREALRRDFLKLSTEIPQTAEDIARASFSVKSAFADLTEPQLIAFLRETGLAATASNAQIDVYAESVVGLAKAFGVAASELPAFSSQLSATLGEALGRDQQVFAGLNKLIVPAKLANQSLKDLFASFATLQAVSSDSEANTTNLVNAYNKLTDAKTQARLQDLAGISTTDQQTGKLKDLSVVVNELAEKLKTLTPAEQSGLLAKILPDAQARAAFGVLLGDIDNYNRRLRDASDAEAFRQKTEVMLAGAEARWQLFKNNVLVILTDIGGSILRNTTTWGGYFESLFNDATANSAKFFLQAGERVGLLEIGFKELFGAFNATEAANAREELKAAVQQLYTEVGNTQTTEQQRIIEKEREYWQRLASDPAASQAVKANAARQLSVLAESAAQAQQAGQKVGEGFGVGIPQGLRNLTPAINTAAKNAVQVPTAAATAAGQKLGVAMGAGMVAGLRGYSSQVIGMADATVAAIKSRFTSAQGLDIHSPSKVFEGYGHDIIDGLILGITNRGAALAKAVQKEITDRVKAAAKGLEDAQRELAGLLGEGPVARRQRTQTEETSDRAGKVEELRKLRAYLEIPVELAIPATMEALNRQLEILGERKDNIEKARALLKQYNEEAAKTTTETEKVNRLLANPRDVAIIGERAAAMLQLGAAMKDFKDAAKSLPVLDRKPVFGDPDENSKAAIDVVLPPPIVVDERAKEIQRAIEQVQQALAESFNRIITGFTGGFKSGIRAIYDEIKNAAKSLLSSVVSSISQTLTSKILSGGQSSGGSILGALRGIFGGGGGGGIGTPNFNPNAGGGNPTGGGIRGLLSGGNGGLLSRAAGFLGLGGGVGASAATAGAGGLLGSAGVSTALTGPVGSLVGTAATGGLVPGAATAGAGGGLSLASLGAFASNPITLAVAGAALGGFLLYRHFRHGTEKKLRAAIQARYGITIRDMALLTQIKQMGEAKFGKGKVGARIQETLALSEVQESLRGYAEQTGQDASRLAPSSAQLGNENFAGNRFIAGGLGGTEYAGENRSQANYFNGGFGGGSSTAAGGGSFGASGGGDSSLRSIVAGLAVAVSELHGTVKGLTSMPEGVLVKKGLEDSPGLVGESLSRDADNNGNLLPSLFYKGGLS